MSDSELQGAGLSEVSMQVFLESTPPGVQCVVSDLYQVGQNSSARFVATPNITLHCGDTLCGGPRVHSCDNRYAFTTATVRGFLVYQCQNCRQSNKVFSVQCKLENLTAMKFGEIPNFGPPTPARALKLIGPDRELFLKGRRCELNGLGVGAFTYYRRVIEDQKVRIFDEIIRVLNTTDPDNQLIPELERAKQETQFSKSVEAIKHALPASLMINGQNPLRLLHSALSEGVHSLSDEQCLALAGAVRLVLFEFSERLAQSLRDDAELASAVSLLSRAKAS